MGWATAGSSHSSLPRAAAALQPACLPPYLLSQPFQYLGCAASTGLMVMAFAWVLLDFSEDPSDGGGSGGGSGSCGGENFSSPPLTLGLR